MLLLFLLFLVLFEDYFKVMLVVSDFAIIIGVWSQNVINLIV